jgi:hypothetical protein
MTFSTRLFKPIFISSFYSLFNNSRHAARRLPFIFISYLRSDISLSQGLLLWALSKKSEPNKFSLSNSFSSFRPIGTFLWEPAVSVARVARYVLLQQTKTGKNVPNNPKIYQMATKYTNGRK